MVAREPQCAATRAGASKPGRPKLHACEGCVGRQFHADDIAGPSERRQQLGSDRRRPNCAGSVRAWRTPADFGPDLHVAVRHIGRTCSHLRGCLDVRRCYRRHPKHLCVVGDGRASASDRAPQGLPVPDHSSSAWLTPGQVNEKNGAREQAGATAQSRGLRGRQPSRAITTSDPGTMHSPYGVRRAKDGSTCSGL